MITKSELSVSLSYLEPEELRKIDELIALINPNLLPYPGQPQEEFAYMRGGEVFYGGTRGGAKTHGLILSFNEFRQYWERKRKGVAQGVIFRRTMPELEEIIELSKSLYPFTGGKWWASRSTWRWPNGAYLRLRYLDKDEDASKYQGHNINWIGIDEAGNFPSPDPINRLRGALRTSRGVDPELRLTGNPGGPGHSWLKTRYILGQYEQRMNWFVRYIHSTIENNPNLIRFDPGYMDRLRDAGPDWLVRAWLEGDWDITPGGFFDGAWNSQRQVIQPFEIPQSWPVYIGFDWGFDKPSALVFIAISDGRFAKTTSGNPIFIPEGSAVVFDELYTCQKNRMGDLINNAGLRLTNQELGKVVLDKLKEHEHRRIVSQVADSSIFSDEGGESIFKQMNRGAGGGLELRPCVKDRRNVRSSALLQLMRSSFRGRIDVPGIWVFQTCPCWARIVPELPADPQTMDSVWKKSEDHLFDATGYALNPYHAERGVSVTRIGGI